MIEKRTFASPEALAATLAETVAADLRAAIGRRDQASLALSGGSTPKRFLAALAQQPLPWDRVFATLVDERWVPPSEPRSNAALVQTHLVAAGATDLRFVPLYNGAATPEDGLAATEAALADMPLPLDVAVLGMGADGHTASFFPGGDNLDQALGETGGLVAAMRAPGAGEPRVTLTRATLLRSGRLYLHIEGAEKLAVLEQALMPGPVEEMPVRAMLHQDQADLIICHAP